MALRDWINLCDAAGFPVMRMTPGEVYMLAQKIIADEQLRIVAIMFLDHGILQKGTRAKILRGWPESERVALRERVTGVVQIGAKRESKRQ